MKAVQIDNYSKTVDSVKIGETSIPEIKPDEVLIRVKSVGINPVDNMITRGDRSEEHTSDSAAHV